ncbi:MAG TPA: hypothetical protein VER04_12875, partial [Polyangiaceae bacterium]|nr:hypothetical protein [Polyangiaceae bacterium]
MALTTCEICATQVRILFVMDPAETMTADKDTSFAFIRGAMARG